MREISEVVRMQNDAISKRTLHPIEKRISVLKKLKSLIHENTDQIEKALHNDLGKPEFEAYISEIDFVCNEIDHTIKKIKKWSKPKKVSSSLIFFPVKSYIYSEPYGKALIMSPWNYPFMLALSPVIGAISAGNCVVLKPSEVSPNTADVLAKIINENFDSSLLSVILGGVPETTEILSHKFDYIFYTGNGHVGRIVMAAAAKNLTPVTLELGGKSPCLVFNKDIDLAAKRTVWGKFFNSGQTCVAPDYILITKDNKEKFVESCQKWIKYFYGEKVQASKDYGRIINESHFDRIVNYIEDESQILLGGQSDKENLYISPTLLSATKDSKVMAEEIFGPLLPIVEIESLGKAIDFVRSESKPLACYAFVDESHDKSRVIDEISCGGMVINDTIVHLSNENLPFGGVGESGMGAYHGRYSFKTFSHEKSVMKRSLFFENNVRYPPYKGKLALIRKLFSIF